MTYEEKK